MKKQYALYKEILIWLFASFFGALAFIVLVGSFLLFQKQAVAHEEVRAYKAQKSLEQIGDRVYEFSSSMFGQVEALRATVDPETWKEMLRGGGIIAPEEVAYYRADNSGVVSIARNANGGYTTMTEDIPSRALALLQRAQTLRAHEIFITPPRDALACDYSTCDTGSSREFYVYVTPLYDDANMFLGALLVAYNADVWGYFAQDERLPDTFFVIDAQGYYAWHKDRGKRTERTRRLPSSFFVDFTEEAAENILSPAGGRVVVLPESSRVYMYPIRPTTEMIRNGKRMNLPTPVTAPVNQYFVIGFIE